MGKPSIVLGASTKRVQAFPNFGYNRLHSPQKTDPQMKDAAGEKEHVFLDNYSLDHRKLDVVPIADFGDHNMTRTGEDIQPLLPPYSEIRNDSILQNVVSCRLA